MWESFAQICALKMQCTTIHQSVSSFKTYLSSLKLMVFTPVDRDEQAETKTAYQLFTGNTGGPITIFDLRRIARQLKENVTEGQLEDMLLEASGKMTVNQYVTSWTPNQTKPHSLSVKLGESLKE